MHEEMNIAYDNETQSICALRQQLVSSLKFHHRETLAKLPLEAAVAAIAEAWQSSHPEQRDQYCQEATEILSGQNLAKLLG